METKKLKKLAIADFIKENPSAPRLQSLRLPRDLSLGESKIPKKIYKPNLNVIRNKEKLKSVCKRDKEPRENSRESQNTPKQKFVQSTGIFSEGIGNTLTIPERRNYFKEVETPSVKVNKTPPLVTKKEGKEVKNYPIKYEDDSDDEEKTKSAFVPINWQFDKLEPLKDEMKEKWDFTSILQNDESQQNSNLNPSVGLWQLPDSFCIKNKTNKKLMDCKITDLPEGEIGKLCIRKSGKVEVHIGSTNYELEHAGLESFMEKVVSLNNTTPDKSTAIALKKVERRFILNPSWPYLLK